MHRSGSINGERGDDFRKILLDLEFQILTLEDRILKLTPDLERMEKYPSLKHAYEAYLEIDKLIGKHE